MIALPDDPATPGRGLKPESRMKRILTAVLVIILLVLSLSVYCFAADLEISASFEDGFSDNSGKLALNVTNVSASTVYTDVSLRIIPGRGVSMNGGDVILGEIEPSGSAVKDVVLTFDKISFFTRYRTVILVGVIVFALLIAAALTVLIRTKKASGTIAMLLALCMMMSLCASVRADDSSSEGEEAGSVFVKRSVEVTHRGFDFTVDIEVGATAATPVEPHPLKGTQATSPTEDYNTPAVSLARIREGIGPLTEHWIYIGKNEFMFLGQGLDEYTGKSHFSPSGVRHVCDNLIKLRDFAAANGIDFYVLFVPDKSSVYSDYVPKRVVKGESSRRLQVAEYIRENTDLKFLDVTDALVAAREKFGDTLYYKYDTHWTQHAGFVAYTELMNLIRQDHPNAVYYNENYFNVTEFETYMKDNAYYLGYYDHFTDFGPVYSLRAGPEAILTSYEKNENTGQYRFCAVWEDGFRDNLPFVKFCSKNTDAPSLYMLRDSFSIAMFPFMKESFSESSFDWSYSVKGDALIDSGADILVLEIVEYSIGELANIRVRTSN